MTARSRHDEQGDVRQIRAALNGHFKRGVGGCATCHKGHDALDSLVAALAAAEARAERAEDALQGALKFAEGIGLTDATFWVRDVRAALAEAGRVPEPAPPEQAAPSEPRETTRTVESPSRKDAAENRRGDAASGSLGAEGAHRCPDGSWSKSRRRRCRLPLGHAGPHVYEVNVAAEGAPPPEGTA